MSGLFVAFREAVGELRIRACDATDASLLQGECRRNKRSSSAGRGVDQEDDDGYTPLFVAS